MFSRIILLVCLVINHCITLIFSFALSLPSPSASPLLRQVESDSARRKRKRLELEAQHTAKLRDLLAQSLIGEGGTVSCLARGRARAKSRTWPRDSIGLEIFPADARVVA